MFVPESKTVMSGQETKKTPSRTNKVARKAVVPTSPRCLLTESRIGRQEAPPREKEESKGLRVCWARALGYRALVIPKRSCGDELELCFKKVLVELLVLLVHLRQDPTSSLGSNPV